MGKRDSSLTRVQPVFRHLFDHDPSGRTWLARMLMLGHRSKSGLCIPIADDLGELAGPPCFERKVGAPRRFLRWLIENRAELSTKRELLASCGDETRAKREALFEGDPAVIDEAIGHIESSAPSERAWWAFEGPSYIDCAIETDRAVVLFEGKRTELEPSRGISWSSDRNQVLRNVECAGTIAGGRSFFVMLIIEEPSGPDDPRFTAALGVSDVEQVRRSLRHLAEAERLDLLGHYVGLTTWQRIAAEFKIPASVLIDSV